jgi:hypothetical protein
MSTKQTIIFRWGTSKWKTKQKKKRSQYKSDQRESTTWWDALIPFLSVLLEKSFLIHLGVRMWVWCVCVSWLLTIRRHMYMFLFGVLIIVYLGYLENLFHNVIGTLDDPIYWHLSCYSVNRPCPCFCRDQSFDKILFVIVMLFS